MQVSSPSVTVAKFTSAAVISVALIASAMGAVARNVAHDEGVRNARDVTLAIGTNAIIPVLQDGILSRDPTAIAAIDSVVRSHVLSSQIVRVKIWASDGTVLYSDDATLIGQNFTLGSEEQQALQQSMPVAELSNLSSPENKGDRQFKKLLEVYDGIRTPSGVPVLFEAYLRYSAVEEDSLRLLRDFAPAVIGGLALLLVVQIPLALGMARRLEHGQRERERLLHRNVMATEVERRHIASDLHDGVVQRLVGTSLSLTAVASTAEQSGATNIAQTVKIAAMELRQAVRELRTMIVSIAPPRLHEEGLASALSDLTSPLAAQGIAVTLDVVSPSLSTEAEVLLYRATREAIRNIVKHAHASEVTVRLGVSANATIRCVITDNGVGFGKEQADESKQRKHVGLGLLRDLVMEANGTLVVDSSPGLGTTVTVEVPLT